MGSLEPPTARPATAAVYMGVRPSESSAFGSTRAGCDTESIIDRLFSSRRSALKWHGVFISDKTGIVQFTPAFTR
eukprot:4998775-Ditylum_brightwellii.AAC.1